MMSDSSGQAPESRPAGAPPSEDQGLPEGHRTHQMDQAMLGGCFTIGILAVLCHLLTIWPFFIFAEHTITGLQRIFMVGGLPVLILGLLASWRFSFAGYSGFVGGAVASAAFMYLRLDQTFLGAISPNLPAPEYPERWKWMIPLAWIAACALLGGIALGKDISDRENDGAVR